MPKPPSAGRLRHETTTAAEVALFLNDDVYLRSYNHARLILGIPLPPDR